LEKISEKADLEGLSRGTRVRVFGFTSLAGCWVSVGDGTFVRESDMKSPWFNEDSCTRMEAASLSRHDVAVLVG
jgi:hypothetical protein